MIHDIIMVIEQIVNMIKIYALSAGVLVTALGIFVFSLALLVSAEAGAITTFILFWYFVSIGLGLLLFSCWALQTIMYWYIHNQYG